MNVGESQSFAYTGGIQTFTVPAAGLYKLEVWGAVGGNASNSKGSKVGGKGGNASGYILLAKKTILYIVCGGSGYQSGTSGAISTGGYNGGGNGQSETGFVGTYAGSGGGATHIALVTGTLINIGKNNFDAYGLLVAGGGGGAYIDNDPTIGSSDGGAGGAGPFSTAFGQGASAGQRNGGGGGGYYGGKARGGYYGAYGGSNWTDGVPTIIYEDTTYNPSTSNGVNDGNGKAAITLIAKDFPTIHAFGKDIIGGYAYGKEISDIKAYGKDLA